MEIQFKRLTYADSPEAEYLLEKAWQAYRDQILLNESEFKHTLNKELKGVKWSYIDDAVYSLILNMCKYE